MDTLRNLFRILSSRERKQVVFLILPLLCLTALIQVVGIASVLPFLAIVADPAAVEKHELLGRLYAFGGFSDRRSFLTAVGALMFVFIVGSNALSALSNWAVLRFSWMRNHTISLRLLRAYLAKPYLFFLQRHSSDLAKNLVSEVSQAVAGMLVPAMQTASKILAALAVLALLLYIEPLLALITALLMGGLYGVLFFAIRRRQRTMGKERLAANRDRFAVVTEAFGGIKEIQLLGRENEVLRRFSRPSFRFASTTARNAIVVQLPRFALETVAFGGIVVMVLYLLQGGLEIETMIPILGLYAFAGYRLMPSLQAIFQGLTTMRFNMAVLEHLIEDLPDVSPRFPRENNAHRMRFTESIRFRDVTFGYPTAKGALFQALNLEVMAGSSVALVGETGSGKSTLADLILGMLRPDEGTIEIDGRPLDDDNMRAWQRNLGYVPQSIFLTNDTLTRNIAFGIPDEEIDHEAVIRATEIACIDQFIRTELPDGLETIVGERGVRLSGGQRQRIGIARALYRNPDVIVFDEATSSLDGGTEAVVVQAITEAARQRTTITIAHRLSTIRHCDRIFLLSGGEVIDSGSYEELLSTSADFRALAQLNVSEG
jgi:ABC-type bacteriocin/lantibiotic exporter with double-glycine peptidase domain